MNPIYIIAAVLILWVVLFIRFMIMNSKRKAKAGAFAEGNKDKAVIHLYCKNISIDGQKASEFCPITGENLEKVVALEAGNHSFEGIFQSTDIGMGTNKNLESEKVQFELYLEKGHTYSAAMYLYSPEDRKAYYNGDVGKDILSIPLNRSGEGQNISAYIICYEED